MAENQQSKPVQAKDRGYTSSSLYSEKISGVASGSLSSSAQDTSLCANHPGAVSHPQGKLRAVSAKEEYRYWEDNYVNRDYIDRSLDFSRTYGPAYRYGIEAFSKHSGKPYENIDEAALREGWENFKDKSELVWERAKDAVRDAYHRLRADES